MRNLAFLLAFVLCPGFCQSPTSKPVEPEILGAPFLLDATSQTLKPLAEEQWKAKSKRSGMFDVDGVFEVEGEHSSVRLANGSQVAFVFKVEHPESVKLYQSLPAKKQRVFAVVQNHGGGSTQHVIPPIPAVLTKYGESSYKLVPEATLSPGEYAVIYAGKVLTFGIDG